MLPKASGEAEIARLRREIGRLTEQLAESERQLADCRRELSTRREFERDRAVRAEQSEAFIAESLRDVMALPPDRDAMDVLLRRIGERLQVDRCYVYTCRLHEDVWVTDLVYEWCAEGISSELENLKRKGPPGLPEFCDVIDAGEDYVFRRLENLPAETRAWFERRGAREFFSTPITDAHGVSVGYLGLDFVKRPMPSFSSAEVHNIHEAASIVKLCLTRQRALEVLRDAEKTKSDFFASISHDIRTPLNSIIGFTQLLQTETDEALKGEYLQNIAFSGETLLALVNDVLDIFRLDAGRMPLCRTMFDPACLLRRVLATFAPTAAEKGIELKANVAGLPWLSLDEKRVRRLLFNLIGNAVKYTDEGRISVEASFTPVDDTVGRVRFVVQDTGIGISPQDLDKVGRPYVRLNSDATGRGGTGLGLSICRRLVEESGGTLSISSELGKGTTVVVELPQVAYGRVPAVDIPKPGRNGDGQRKKDPRRFGKENAARDVVVNDNSYLPAARRKQGNKKTGYDGGEIDRRNYLSVNAFVSAAVRARAHGGDENERKRAGKRQRYEQQRQSHTRSRSEHFIRRVAAESA